MHLCVCLYYCLYVFVCLSLCHENRLNVMKTIMKTLKTVTIIDKETVMKIA